MRIIVKSFVTLFAFFATVEKAKAQYFADKELNLLSQFVVQIDATKQSSDFDNPWQKSKSKTESYIGTFVGDGLIVLPAEAVADATHLSMIRLGATVREALKIRKIDYEVNLAVLQAANPASLGGMLEAPVETELGPGAELDFINIDDKNRPSLVHGRISKVEVSMLTTSAYRQPQFLIDVKRASAGKSGPAFVNNRLVAIAASSSSGLVNAIPGVLIRHFLDDVKSDHYRGFPDLGIVTNLIDSPLRRLALQAPNKGGVRIVKSTGPSLLRPNDILIQIAGREIDDQGQVEHPIWGKIDFQSIVAGFFGGDSIPLRLVREGQIIDLGINAEQFDSNRLVVPMTRFDRTESYLIVGGLVLQELTRPFLLTWGHNWVERAPIEFVQADKLLRRFQTRPSERIIFLNRVLADSVNLGYGKINYRLIDTVNGLSIHSLKDVETALCDQAIKSGEKRYAQIRFQKGEGEAVLDLNELMDSNKRIARNYGIPNDGFFQQSLCKNAINKS